MSQIQTKKNVSEIERVPPLLLKNTMLVTAVISKPILSGISSVIASGAREITTPINVKSITIGEAVNREILSPIKLRNDFNQTYSRNLCSVSDLNVMEKQKEAIIETVANSEYIISSPEIIRHGMNRVLKSNSQRELKRSVESVMNEIQTQHSTVFTKQISQIVKEASLNAGFTKEVSVKEIDNKTTVIAINNKGQALLSEIRTDSKSKQIDLVTETIGFTGDSCNSVLKSFNENLNSKGLKFASSSSKRTGGACWLPSSQAVKKQLQKPSVDKEKKKQVDRKKLLAKQQLINSKKIRTSR